ncbi:MAG: hypothetical protein ACLFRP_04825 [Puniceicoccaceae bacterium]
MPEISFTSSELELLGRAVHVADWVANSHAGDSAGERLPLDEIPDKIYRALNAGKILEPWPEDPETGRIFEPREWEEKNLTEIVDPFADEAAYERIIELAADQVFRELFGENAFADTPEKAAGILASIEDAIEQRCEEGASIRISIDGWHPRPQDFARD